MVLVFTMSSEVKIPKVSKRVLCFSIKFYQNVLTKIYIFIETMLCKLNIWSTD